MTTPDAFQLAKERYGRNIREAFGLSNEDRVHEYPKTRENTALNEPLARYEHRSYSTRHAMHWLQPNPNLQGRQKEVAEIVWGTAEQLAQLLCDGIELSAGLQLLRQSRDCFVIQSLEDGEDTC